MWPREDGNYWTWSLNEQEVVLTAATSKPEGVSDHSEAQRRTQDFFECFSHKSSCFVEACPSA